ncbi:class II fructose-bisphosphate aldolase, partial [Halanaerobium sp. Z-7514]
GASGISAEDLNTAVAYGVNKVNVNTDFQQAFTAKIKEVYAEKPELYDPRKYCGPGRDAITEKVKEKIKILGSNDKAW